MLHVFWTYFLTAQHCGAWSIGGLMVLICWIIQFVT